MRLQNNQQQQNDKLAAEKVTRNLPLPPVTPVKVKREAPATATVVNVVHTSQSSADDEERVFKCEQEGCYSSFKTRSSLRDHQKGNK